MVKALTIQKELIQMGAVSTGLPDDVLLAIAGIIGREAEYATIKEMVADIATLVNTGAGVTLDAEETLTIEEIVQQTGDSRQCGWALQAGIGYELVDPFGNPQNVIVAASADAALAFGEDQFMFHAGLSGPFDIMSENTLWVDISHEFALAGGSTLSTTGTLQRVQPAGGSATMSRAGTIGLAFDVGGADVLLQLSMTHDTGDPDWTFDFSISASMDLL